MTSASDRVLGWAPYVLLSITVMWVASHALHPIADPDAWWHLRLGRDLLDDRSLSAPAHWSTFATIPWVPTQPLPEMALAIVERVLGLAGVVWVYVASVVALVIGLYVLIRGFASPLPAVVATMLFVATAEAAMTPRPQLISYGLLAVVIVAWLHTEQDLRPRWWLIPLSLLWSLCHGFWFLGAGYGALAVLAIAVGVRPPRATLFRLASVPIGSVLVVLLNPGGPRVLVAPFAVGARGQFITEWQHAALTSGPTVTVLATVLLCAAVWARQRQEVTAFRVVVAVTAVVASWYAVRTVALGGVVMAPLVASALQSVLAGSRTGAGSASAGATETVGHRVGRRELRGLLAGGAVLLALAAAAVPHVADRPGDDVPVAFDGPLDALPPGTTVLDDYTIGGWLAWRHPHLNRWVDGLADAYPVSHLRDVTTVQFLDPGWRRALAGSGATVAILREGSTAVRAFEADGWEPVATDRGWVLLRLAGVRADDRAESRVDR
jgi:hypothetical protein